MRDSSSPDTISIRRLSPIDEPELAALFAANVANDTTQWFDPFPLDDQTAHRLTHYQGRDLYWGIIRRERMVGLFMVRGWDAGHPHRAMGIFIDARERRGANVGIRAGWLVGKHLRSIGETVLRANVHKDNRALQATLMVGFREVERRGDRVIVEAQLDDAALFPGFN